ncbi:MAG: hypothetical protein PHO84_08020 [Dysgonamonadaceae bacterium]|jgi:hypothetical protein|nr:hypothetical protein [Dysgonamonadaceae bacterium]MDD3356148.1 hypothetical protein [Dysgonamonadaceae bacterium]MDD3727549.1 hypothetical protein [Dysgonamonadaceae bacterium]MDD4247083.1 hypothetical protein [Dysgonamonadaceae bacterium]MDD4605578.1 hypothetical protein [Dysgonamonadaceae bacterium]
MFFFYNNRKPRQFNYKPILFDPDKDEFNERVLKVKKEMGVVEDSEFKPTIKGEFIRNTNHVRRKINREGSTGKSNTKRNVTLAVFLVVLVLVAYFIYFT